MESMWRPWEMVYGFPERCKWSAACHHCIRFHIDWSSPTSVLGYLRAHTCSLQAEAMDVMQAVGDIDVVLTSLKEVSNTIDHQHDAWSQEIELMCRSVDVVPSIPWRCASQRHRNNVPADDPRTYYRRCTSVPLVDHLLVELETRFSPHHHVALLRLCLVGLPDPDVKSHLAKLVDLCEEDPQKVCPIRWSFRKSSGSSRWSNMARSFSTLKRLKTYLRSTCGNERLTSLALMHIHRDVPAALPVLRKWWTSLPGCTPDASSWRTWTSIYIVVTLRATVCTIW